jgi:ribonuclease HI
MKRAVIHADGASLGNPGDAGIGVVVEIDGQVTEIARYIGTATNNIAEYSALIAGLEEASRQGAEEVDVRLDSELAVKQMLGQYKVKNAGLRPLFVRAKRLSGSFGKFSIRHVPREENAHADRLSKIGAKGSTRLSSQNSSSGGGSGSSGRRQGVMAPNEEVPKEQKKSKEVKEGGQGELF